MNVMDEGVLVERVDVKTFKCDLYFVRFVKMKDESGGGWRSTRGESGGKVTKTITPGSGHVPTFRG